MRFELEAQDGAARCGCLIFERGLVETPAFMPVGTYGTVKAMTAEELTGLGSQIVELSAHITSAGFHSLLRRPTRYYCFVTVR